MRHAFAITLFLICFCTTNLFAEEPDFGSGAGLKTCAEFAKAYQSQPQTIEYVFFTWAQGYMTGWNIASENRILQVDVSVWDVDAQKSYIRKYCDLHPLNQYIESVLSLVGAMKYDDAKIHGIDDASKR